MLQVGSKAPDFSLPDQNNQTINLADFSGRHLILYFYPKDNTPGCTKEACGFRDSWDQFNKAGISVVGVSKDSHKSHAKFADKYNLPFTLLSDEDAKVCSAYEAYAPKKFMGREFMGVLRVTYVIDPQGKIALAFPKVTPSDHATKILEAVKGIII